MKDHPIIFSAPMVQALLGGRKTMTRRLAWVPHKGSVKPGIRIGYETTTPGHGNIIKMERPSPWQRVQPGDRLWVRESVKLYSRGHDCEIEYCDKAMWGTGPNTGEIPDAALVSYFRAVDRAVRSKEFTASIPSIHMPRWASRITMIVTGIKIEPLQKISEADAKAEGLEWVSPSYGVSGIASSWNADPRISFTALWRTLHGAESWDANPEVVALSFRVIAANIDQPKARAA